MTKFIQCAQCNVKMTDEKCKFATYGRLINGKEITFCCEKCAEHYESKKKTRAS